MHVILTLSLDNRVGQVFVKLCRSYHWEYRLVKVQSVKNKSDTKETTNKSIFYDFLENLKYLFQGFMKTVDKCLWHTHNYV